jgi:hypothetical protein
MERGITAGLGLLITCFRQGSRFVSAKYKCPVPGQLEMSAWHLFTPVRDG